MRDARLLEGVVEVDLSLLSGGWQWGDDVEHGSLLTVWQQATTIRFLGIVACQIGTGLAARTQLASISKIGAFSNPLLLWGIAFEVAFAAAVVTIPPLQSVFDTAVPTWWQLAMLAPFPLIVLPSGSSCAAGA